LLGLLDNGKVCDFLACGSETEIATGTSAGALEFIEYDTGEGLFGGGLSTRTALEALGVGTRGPMWGD